MRRLLTKLSMKSKCALGAIIGYSLLYLFVSFPQSMTPAQGVVTALSDTTLTVEASTGNQYDLNREANMYSKSKTIGDSIELGIQHGKAYDRVEAQGIEINQRTTRAFTGIGVGILGIISLFVIAVWPFGESYLDRIKTYESWH